MSNQVKSMVAEYFRVFMATSLALFLADGADLFAIDGSSLKTYVNAGVAAALPLILRAVNKKDTAFGITK
jgi:hypothetical protein